jgi:hypothetical protein
MFSFLFSARQRAGVLLSSDWCRDGGHLLDCADLRVVCSVAYIGIGALPFKLYLILTCMHFSRVVRRYAAVASTPLPMWDSMKLCAAFYTDPFMKSQYRPHTNKNGRWIWHLVNLWRGFLLFFPCVSSFPAPAPACSSALSEDATLEVTSATWVACNGSISALGSASISLSLSSTQVFRCKQCILIPPPVPCLKSARVLFFVFRCLQEGTCVKTGMTCPVTSVTLSNTTIAGSQCTAFPSATTFAYLCVTRDTTQPAITDLQVYATGKCELGSASFDLYASNDLRAAPRADQEGFPVWLGAS